MKKLAIILAIILVLLCGIAGGYYYFIFNKNNPVVAEAAGEEIRLNEYKERLFGATGQGSPIQPASLDDAVKESVLNELIDLKIIDKELIKRNIQVPENELVDAAKKKFIDYEQADKNVQVAYKNYIRLEVAREKLVANIGNWKEGYILYCYYNREDTEGKLKAYAKDYCEKMRERLESHRSDYDAEVELLKTDITIGEESWKPRSVSLGEKLEKNSFSANNFDSSTNIFSQISNLSNDKDKYYILSTQDTNVKGTSEIDQTVEAKDGGYALVYIREGNKGEAQDFDKWLQDKEKEYKTKSYVDRIKI